jgi:hypothetical protein
MKKLDNQNENYKALTRSKYETDSSVLGDKVSQETFLDAKAS